MSRSGYSDDYDGTEWDLIRWRGAVKSAIRGKRGQAFLKEMLTAMDSLPVKELVQGELEGEGKFCAIGTVGMARGIDMSEIDPDEYGVVADKFGISQALAREIVFENDEGAWYKETPENRFIRMRKWIEDQIK